MKTLRKAKRALDCALLRAKFGAADRMEQFLKEERGDTNFVAIIVIIVIILAVAGIFRTQLLTAVNQVMSNLTDFIG